MFSRYQLANFDLLLAEEEIRQPIEWRVGDDRHHFIIHLGGQMNQLKTEINGHAGCVCPAVPGEVWSVPVEHLDDASLLTKATLSDAILRRLEERYLCNPQTTDIETVSLLEKSDARLLRNYIYENLAEQITIDMLARLVDLTTYHLLIAFRHAFRTTPAQYLINQRIRKAQWLLLHTIHDVIRVAFDTGFSSHSHFSSAFRNRTGFSPTEFRRRCK